MEKNEKKTTRRIAVIARERIFQAPGTSPAPNEAERPTGHNSYGDTVKFAEIRARRQFVGYRKGGDHL